MGERIPTAVAPKYRAQRVRRTRLQQALIAKVPKGVIKLRKKLVSLQNIEGASTRLVFEDGEEVVADLVIGGDGIRSVCFCCHYSLHNTWLTAYYRSFANMSFLIIPLLLQEERSGELLFLEL
jgi:hypothetical protein